MSLEVTIMDWTQALFGGVVLVVLLAPVGLMALAVLGLLVSQLFAPASMVCRASFDCPFSHRRVHAAFETRPDLEHPDRVLSCSMFGEPKKVTCEARCREIVDTAWAPSPMVPRFSLIAGGAAPR